MVSEALANAGFRELTNIDVAVLLQELLPLVGARLEKAYQTSPTEFVFRFKGSGSNTEGSKKQDVTVFLPYAVMLTERAPQESEPTHLATILRKHLDNKQLTSIEQLNFDRILVFSFGESGEFKIIVELFRKGNLILTDNDNKILAIQRVEEAKDRVLKTGTNYVAPAMKKAEPTIDAIQKVMEKDWKDEKVVVVVTRNINFPALYLNELLTARGLDPKTPFDRLTEKEKGIIASEIHEFMKEITEKIGIVLKNDGNYLITERDPKIDDRLFPSLSALLAELHASGKKVAKKTASGSAAEKARNKLKHQEKHMLELLKEAEEEKIKGGWIKTHAHEIEELIKEYKLIRKNGKKDELDAFLKRIKATVKKEGIEIEIE